MSDQIKEGLAFIWSSDFVQKNPTKAYKNLYASEYTKVAAFLNGGPEPIYSGFSKLGKGLCEIESARRALPTNDAYSAPTQVVT